LKENYDDKENGLEDSELDTLCSYEEASNILKNLKGNYTTEKGIGEVFDLVDSIKDILIDAKTPQEGKTELELAHILLPDSRNKTGLALEPYLAKIRDALYVTHKIYYPMWSKFRTSSP
jgi:hypothetical protein